MTLRFQEFTKYSYVLNIDRCLNAKYSFLCFSFLLLDRYFDDDKGDCFPCSKCCQDEQDVVENECREKLGTGSNMICSFHSSINRCDKSTPFAQESTTTTDQSTITNNYTTPSQSSKHEHTVPPTAQPAKHHDLLIAVGIFVPLIIIIIIIAVCLYIHKARLTGCYSWCNCNTKTGVAEMENGAYPTCRGNCKPTKKNLGRTAMFY